MLPGHLRDVEIMTGCVADAVEPRGTDTTCLGKSHWWVWRRL